MNITPRKTETDAIVALLERDYPDAVSLARDIVKTAYEALLAREWWLTVVRLGEADSEPLQVAYGLSATHSQAMALELGGPFPRMVLPVTSARGQIARAAKLETVPVAAFEPPVRRPKKKVGSS